MFASLCEQHKILKCYLVRSLRSIQGLILSLLPSPVALACPVHVLNISCSSEACSPILIYDKIISITQVTHKRHNSWHHPSVFVHSSARIPLSVTALVTLCSSDAIVSCQSYPFYSPLWYIFASHLQLVPVTMDKITGNCSPRLSPVALRESG